MIKVRVFWFLLVLFSSQIVLNAQEYKDHMTDFTWSYYNKNIQSFNNQRLGESLKYGLDNNYVDNIISVDHPAFHSISAFYKETFAYIDFNKKINEPYYNLKFDKEDNVTFPELIFYLADKYAAYFDGPNRSGFVDKKQAAERIEEFDLKNCKKVILREQWYYHNLTGKMVSRILDIGFIPKNTKSDPAAIWVDFSYIKFDDLGRIQPRNIGGIGNVVEYFSLPTFSRDFYSVNYSTYDEQKKLQKFSTQVDAYFWKFQLEEQFRAYKKDGSIKKKWKKNQVKTDFIKGTVSDAKKRIGEWKVFDYNEKLMGKFTFSNDSANGAYTLYHSNGEKKETGSLFNGRKVDTIYNYDREGKLIAKQTYSEGFLNGPSAFYHKNGQLHSAATFSNDSLKGDFNSFYADGTPYMKGVFKRGYFWGSWEINVKLNDVMCGYLRDENDYSLLSDFFEMNALDDCVATFDMFFKHRIARECFQGICVIPDFNSLIR